MIIKLEKGYLDIWHAWDDDREGDVPTSCGETPADALRDLADRLEAEDDFSGLAQDASMMLFDAFDDLEANKERFANGQPGEVYAALFQSDLGVLVLEDLYREFSAVTRWHPDEPVERGFYREGASSVVDFILHKLAENTADSQQESANG